MELANAPGMTERAPFQLSPRAFGCFDIRMRACCTAWSLAPLTRSVPRVAVSLRPRPGLWRPA